MKVIEYRIFCQRCEVWRSEGDGLILDKEVPVTDQVAVWYKCTQCKNTLYYGVLEREKKEVTT